MSISGMGSGPYFTDDAERGMREAAKIQRQKPESEGAVKNKGALLAKDTMDIPLGIQLKIEMLEAEAGRPFLSPLTQTRMAEEREIKDFSHHYYIELRNNLSPRLKEKLIEDEALDFEERDPIFIALDESLKFDANLLAAAHPFTLTGNEENPLRAEIPIRAQKEMVEWGSQVTKTLETYLSEIGPNDPSYDLLVPISNHLKEALEFLNSHYQAVSQQS